MARQALRSRSVSSSSNNSRRSGRSLKRQETSASNPRSSQTSENAKDNTCSAVSVDSTERSPLLSPSNDYMQTHNNPDGIPSGLLEWNEGGEEEESKSVLYLFLLTLSIGGLQMAWAVEFSNGSPYLQSLGMSKALLAFIWIAGPLSGALVQPYVGIRSDNCRISWGKRMPFMVGGTIATTVSLFALAWARDIVHGFLGLFGADPESHRVRICTMIWAVLFVYTLDSAINTVQAGIRAFIVDNAPTHQQEDANAWAGRITGVGNILGYLFGYVNLPQFFPFLGSTQFEVLCVIAAFALCSTVLISAFSIRERDPRLEGPPHEKLGMLGFFGEVFRSILRLPPQVRKVCEAQFFGWLGWFGFLFYITTYIGQLQLNPYFAANPSLAPSEIEHKWEEATRIGTFALLIFAITSFASNMLLPFLIIPSYNPPPIVPKTSAASASHHDLSASIPSLYPPSSAPNAALHYRLSRLLNLVQIQWLTLRRAWLLAHLLFALSMACTFFITTPTQAIVLTGIVGLPWALTLWAPFALISAEISKRDTEARRNPTHRDHNNDAREKKNEDQAGVILGLHNVAVSVPQIIATLVSSVIFKLAQKPRGTAGDDSVGWVLRFSGLAALVAAFFTWRIGEERDERGSKGDRGRYARVGELENEGGRDVVC